MGVLLDFSSLILLFEHSSPFAEGLWLFSPKDGKEQKGFRDTSD